VNAEPPAIAEAGFSDDTAGAGALMMNISALDDAAPGLSTLTFALPGEAIKLAGMEAVSWLVLT
jgi:hypothetical protein